jgi:hypothetical protein
MTGTYTDSSDTRPTEWQPDQTKGHFTRKGATVEVDLFERFEGPRAGTDGASIRSKNELKPQDADSLAPTKGISVSPCMDSKLLNDEQHQKF